MDRRFLSFFLISGLSLGLLILAVNYWVDPFVRHVDAADGLDRKPAYTLNRRIAKLVEFDRYMARRPQDAPPPLVIIGDSVGNQIDDEHLTQLTGRPVFNLSYGGARLIEMAELGEHVVDHYRIDTIVWSVPLIRMTSDGLNEMPRAIAMARSPLRHSFTYEALRASYLVLRKAWLAIDFADPKVADDPEDAIDYLLARRRMDMLGEPWPSSDLAALERAEAKAERAGTRVMFLVAPVHPRMMQFFLTEDTDRYLRYQTFLAQRCVIDLGREPWSRRWSEAMFRDTMHLKDEFKPKLDEAMKDALQIPCEVWRRS